MIYIVRGTDWGRNGEKLAWRVWKGNLISNGKELQFDYDLRR